MASPAAYDVSEASSLSQESLLHTVAAAASTTISLSNTASFGCLHALLVQVVLAVMCDVSQGEQLAGGALAAEGSHILLASSGGKLAHFSLSCVRLSGRAAGCVKVRRQHEPLVQLLLMATAAAQAGHLRVTCRHKSVPCVLLDGGRVLKCNSVPCFPSVPCCLVSPSGNEAQAW